MSDTSTNSIFKTIEAPALNQSGYGKNVNDQFSNIDTNFKIIEESDFLKGKTGEGLKRYEVTLTPAESAPVSVGERFYRAIKDAIVGSNINTGDIDWKERLGDTKIYVYTLSEEKESELPLGASILYSDPYIFMDPRFLEIDEKVHDYTNITNLTCVLRLETTGGGVSISDLNKSNFRRDYSYPSLYYSNGSFYWKINDQETGLLARGPQGPAGSSSRAWIVKETGKSFDNNDNLKYIDKILITKADTALGTASGFTEGWNEVTTDIINNLPLTDRDPAIVIPHDSDSSGTSFYLSCIYINEENGEKKAGVYIDVAGSSNAVDVKFDSGIFNRMLSRLSQANDGTSYDYLRELFIPFDPKTDTVNRLSPDDVESIPRHTVYPETTDDGTRILHVSVDNPNDESTKLNVSGYDTVTIEPETSFGNNVNVENNIYAGGTNCGRISIGPSTETGYIKGDGNYLAIKHDTADIIMDPGISTGSIKIDYVNGHSDEKYWNSNDTVSESTHIIVPKTGVSGTNSTDLAIIPSTSGDSDISWIGYGKDSYIMPRWWTITDKPIHDAYINIIVPFYDNSDGSASTITFIPNLYRYYLNSTVGNGKSMSTFINNCSCVFDDSGKIIYVLELVDYADGYEDILPKYLFTYTSPTAQLLKDNSHEEAYMSLDDTMNLMKSLKSNDVEYENIGSYYSVQITSTYLVKPIFELAGYSNQKSSTFTEFPNVAFTNGWYCPLEYGKGNMWACINAEYLTRVDTGADSVLSGIMGSKFVFDDICLMGEHKVLRWGTNYDEDLGLYEYYLYIIPSVLDNSNNISHMHDYSWGVITQDSTLKWSSPAGPRPQISVLGYVCEIPWSIYNSSRSTVIIKNFTLCDINEESFSTVNRIKNSSLIVDYSNTKLLGNADISGSLNLGGNADISGTLNLAGNADISGEMSILPVTNTNDDNLITNISYNNKNVYSIYTGTKSTDNNDSYGIRISPSLWAGGSIVRGDGINKIDGEGQYTYLRPNGLTILSYYNKSETPYYYGVVNMGLTSEEANFSIQYTKYKNNGYDNITTKVSSYTFTPMEITDSNNVTYYVLAAKKTESS